MVNLLMTVCLLSLKENLGFSDTVILQILFICVKEIQVIRIFFQINTAIIMGKLDFIRRQISEQGTS